MVSGINHKYVIYGRDECPFTQKAKALLGNRAFYARQSELRDIDLVSNSPELIHLKTMLEESKIMAHRTVPKVFVKGNGPHGFNFIGGYTDLERYIADNGF